VFIILNINSNSFSPQPINESIDHPILCLRSQRRLTSYVQSCEWKIASLICFLGTQIFQIPSLIIMTIVASRTHRSLAEFVTGPTHMSVNFPSFLLWTHNDCPCSVSSGFQTENPPIPKTKRNPGVQITLPPMGGSVRTTGEQYPASQSSLDINEQKNENDKPAIDHDLESGMAERVP